MGLVGHPELVDDERFDSMLKRGIHAKELIEVLDAAFARKTSAEWRTVLDAWGLHLHARQLREGPAGRSADASE
jgi:crotonobetainyl-CoA:carnitine CoA-transferase CaiB-like acyl-CoA transferase